MTKMPTRRTFLELAGGAAIAVVTVRPLAATPAMLNAAIRNVVGEAPVRAGKVTLDIPPLVENGNTVPMTVKGARQEHSRLRREEPAAECRQLLHRRVGGPRAGRDPHSPCRHAESRRDRA